VQTVDGELPQIEAALYRCLCLGVEEGCCAELAQGDVVVPERGGQ
jgi:hypothetical protein